MNLDLGGVLPVAKPDGVEDDQEIQRLISVLMEMQKGINMLTEVVADQKGRIDALELDVRRVKARTDAPKRPVILEAGPWRN